MVGQRVPAAYDQVDSAFRTIICYPDLVTDLDMLSGEAEFVKAGTV